MRWLTVKQYAIKHGKSENAVKRHIDLMHIKGAEKVLIAGHYIWAIPENAPWPYMGKGIPEDFDISEMVEQDLERRGKRKK